jgi:hypothetical protein
MLHNLTLIIHFFIVFSPTLKPAYPKSASLSKSIPELLSPYLLQDSLSLLYELSFRFQKLEPTKISHQLTLCYSKTHYPNPHLYLHLLLNLLYPLSVKLLEYNFLACRSHLTYHTFRRALSPLKNLDLLYKKENSQLEPAICLSN